MTEASKPTTQQAQAQQAAQQAAAKESAAKESSGSSGPKMGEIVLVRQDIRTVIPAIVTNDYAGQNAGGVVSVVTFSSNSYGGSPVNSVSNCQPETKDTTAEDLQTTWQGYYMPVGSDLAKRDLAKEIEEHRKAANPPAETKSAN